MMAKNFGQVSVEFRLLKILKWLLEQNFTFPIKNTLEVGEQTFPINTVIFM